MLSIAFVQSTSGMPCVAERFGWFIKYRRTRIEIVSRSHTPTWERSPGRSSVFLNQNLVDVEETPKPKTFWLKEEAEAARRSAK